MKRILVLISALMVFVSACSDNTPLSPDTSDTSTLKTRNSPGGAGLPGRGTVLRLTGTNVAYPGMVMDIDGDELEDDALCFDVNLLDASGRIIGTATDCLSEITPVEGGLALVGTTTFNLPNGTFIARGYTTVQPLTTTMPSPATHTTGAVPMPGTNGVIHGTGAYENFQAEVRLSGAVNMSRLDSHGEITFDCLFSVLPLSMGLDDDD
jgi:hypothetical protein